MKKKITAAALALCLMLGLLPMSVLAAQYNVTLGGENHAVVVDDTTGAYQEQTFGYYTLAPGTITLEGSNLPNTHDFAFYYGSSSSYYDTAPETIVGTLVKTGVTYTVSFHAGDHATGTMAAVPVTVPNGASEVSYTLPGIDTKTVTPETGYTFTGWSDGTTTYQADEVITLTGDITLTAQWANTVVTVTPSADPSGNATVSSGDVTVTTETTDVVLDCESSITNGGSVTLDAAIVTSVTADVNKVETVTVKTGIATADVPVEALKGASGAVKVEMTPDTVNLDTHAGVDQVVKDAVKVANAVSVKVTDAAGANLFAKKDSYAHADPVIKIEIKGLVSGKTYFVLCLGDDQVLTSFGKQTVANGTTSLTIESKHLSSFIPVEETPENTAALSAVAADSSPSTPVTPATGIKITSVKTDIAPFTKVQVTGLDTGKVYLIRIGAGTGKAGQAVFYVENAASYEFYCNADSTTNNQTVMIWELNAKTDIVPGKMPTPKATETVTKVS